MILKLNHLLFEAMNILGISNIRLGLLVSMCSCPVVFEVLTSVVMGLKLLKKTRSKLTHTDCFLMLDGQVIIKYAICTLLIFIRKRKSYVDADFCAILL